MPKIRNHSGGFILAETIVSMAIIIFSFGILLWNLKIVNIPANYQQISFYRFISLIENDKFKFKFENPKKQGILLDSKSNNKYYRIKKVKNIVTLAGENNGYIPLVQNVKKIEFSKAKDRPEITVIFENGERYRALVSSKK